MRALSGHKVASGLYNKRSEVIREAPRFMENNEELIYQMKLDRLRAKLAESERDMEEGRFTELSHEEIGPFFARVKEQALGTYCAHATVPVGNTVRGATEGAQR